MRFRSILETLSFQQSIIQEELDAAVAEQMQKGIDEIQEQQRINMNKYTQEKLLEKLAMMEKDGNEKDLQFQLLKTLLETQSEQLTINDLAIRKAQIESMEFLAGLQASHDRQAMGMTTFITITVHHGSLILS